MNNIYSEILEKQKFCEKSLFKYYTDKTMCHTMLFYPKDKYYANKLAINLNNCNEIDSNIVTKKILINIAKEWIIFIKSSPYDIYDKNSGSGFWNQISFKINCDNELMIKIMVIKNDWIKKISCLDFQNIIKYIDTKYSVVHNCIYIQWSENQICPNKDDNMQLLWGSNGILENILGINFKITPFTFSQGNSNTCDLLYSTIHNFINIKNNTKIICYGRNVGHICFTIPHKLIIYGYNPCRIVDADLRETLNVNNIKPKIYLFLDEKCDLISNKLSEITNSDQIIILSPGRNGLKKNIINSIKNNRKVNRFYYISCYMKSLVRDLESITNCQITRIQPINLFPSTPFYEILVEIIL
ncbi:putative RNA methyltransferase [Powai lake megavirus]|uniref:Putative RNA methyltransferase n=1 Tax=Powai lake megavirus TaxID=1842663 RepID=A0A167REN2_9VIRU|nr:putative RNA methyltransferase [Powai lake megavirus]ANB50599.1 putative RNA methyltransferase [Powai lake megavirus]